MTRRSPRRPPGCHVTVWRHVKPRNNGNRGVITGMGVPCGEPVVSDGLCAKHAADKARLS